MTPREIIEALIAKGHRRDEICRRLDISPESLYALRYSKAEPSRELLARLRLLAGKAPPVRHARGCPVRYGR